MTFLTTKKHEKTRIFLEVVALADGIARKIVVCG